MMQVMMGAMEAVGFRKKEWGELGVLCGWDGEGTARGRGGIGRWTRGVKACGGGAEVRGEVA
jgi:hypothetical protein